MKATIVGNLGKDSEMKTADNGNTRLVFSVADTVGYGDNKKTQWVNCTLFGKRGDSLQQYLTKGTKVVIFGEVSLRQYDDKNGMARTSIDCVVSDVVLVGGHEKKEAAPAKANDFDNDEIPF